MIPIRQAISSSVGKKVIMAATGLGLVGFVITHLAGNLTLLSPDPGTFNAYAFKLESLGPLLWAAEIGLILAFAVHVISAFMLKRAHFQARPFGYVKWKGKGAPQSNFGSRNMILSGLLLLAFLIIHVRQFKYGPGIADGYITELKTGPARDLHKLVVETFQSPWVVGFYVAAMIFLWLHIKHGFWSAFQSLGALNTRASGPVAVLGWLLATLLALGFLALPLWLYFNVGGYLR